MAEFPVGLEGRRTVGKAIEIESKRDSRRAAGNFYSNKKLNRRVQDGPIKSQSRRTVRSLGTLGNHCNCDSFVKRIWKENTGGPIVRRCSR